MPVISDTTIWSLALRRHPASLNAVEADAVLELDRLAIRGDLYVVGVVRQELLSGVRTRKRFEEIRQRLDLLQLLLARANDHDLAAEFYNRCQDRGVAATHFDMLICSLAVSASASIFTTDRDFLHYASCVPVQIHSPTP